MRIRAIDLFVHEFKSVMEYLSVTAKSETAFKQMLERFGFNTDAIQDFNMPQVRQQISDLHVGIHALHFNDLDSLKDVISKIGEVNDIIQQLRSISENASSDVENVRLVFTSFLERLMLYRIALRYPKFYRFIDFMGFVAWSSSLRIGNVYLVEAGGGKVLDRAALSSFIDNPKDYVFSHFFPGESTEREEMTLRSTRLMHLIQSFLVHLGWKSDVKISQKSLFYEDWDDQIGYTHLITELSKTDPDTGTLLSIFLLFEIIYDQGEVKLVANVEGNLNQVFEIGDWNLEFHSNLSSGTFILGSDHVSAPEGGVLDQAEAGITFSRNEPESIVFGGESTRFEISDIRLEALVKYDNGELNWSIIAALKSLFELKGSDGDNFLSKIFGGEKFSLDIDLEFGFDKRKGLFFGSSLSGGFKRTFDIQKTILNFLTLQRIAFETQFNNDALMTSASTEILINFKDKVKLKVDGTGLTAQLDFGGNFGNLGIADARLEFKKPQGIGVSIDFGNDIKGGGYLYMGDHLYYGALTLQVKDTSLDVIGVLHTELPDGSDGYSLLGLVNVTLPNPVPLAWGFYLRAVGGLAGVNRDMNTDALVAAVKNGSVQTLFFPNDIVNNIGPIIDQLNSYFPVAPGRHSIGILVQLSYGKTKMIIINLGLMISIPSPVVLAIGGTITVKNPEDTGARIYLNCAFLGIIDFSAKKLSFDASLFDSRIGSITASGDMVARFSWGSERVFLISIGGFHPEFKPDPSWNLGTLRRLSLMIRNTDQLKIYGEAYLAVTSNTFQVGAAAEVLYKKGKVKAEAYIRFDALFYFNPFQFTISLRTGAEISWKNKTLMGVDISVVLNGPGRWNARGHATVEILGFDVKVNFDISWGDQSNDSLPAINVLQTLVDELNKPGNWRTSANDDSNVVFRGLQEEDKMIVSPFGMLEVRQIAVPLNYTIQKFYENPVTSHGSISATSVTISNGNAAFDYVSDYFVPGQYKNLGETERLRSASYEMMNSGIRISDPSRLIRTSALFKTKEMSYDQVYYSGIQEHQTMNFDSSFLIEGGILGRNKEFRKEKRNRHLKKKVRVNAEKFSVVNRDNFQMENENLQFSSREAAEEYVQQQNLNHQWRVSPRFEYLEL